MWFPSTKIVIGIIEPTFCTFSGFLGFSCVWDSFGRIFRILGSESGQIFEISDFSSTFTEPQKYLYLTDFKNFGCFGKLRSLRSGTFRKTVLERLPRSLSIPLPLRNTGIFRKSALWGGASRQFCCKPEYPVDRR